MSSPDIGIEEGWTTLEIGFRNAESYIFDQVGFVSTDDYTSLYSVMYRMCTQKPPNNWSDEMYRRFHLDAQGVGARTVARAAGKQGYHYAAALFGVWKSLETYARYAGHQLKYLDRFYVKRLRLPAISDVVFQAFGDALDLEATALGGGAVDRGRDIALLRCMKGRCSCMRGVPLTPDPVRLPGPLEEKWQACLAAQRDLPVVADRRRALALMLVLCAKDPPRAVLGDDPGRLSVAVRLAAAGQNNMVEWILKKVSEEGARELDRAVEALLDEHRGCDLLWVARPV